MLFFLAHAFDCPDNSNAVEDILHIGLLGTKPVMTVESDDFPEGYGNCTRHVWVFKNHAFKGGITVKIEELDVSIVQVRFVVLIRII